MWRPPGACSGGGAFTPGCGAFQAPHPGICMVRPSGPNLGPGGGVFASRSDRSDRSSRRSVRSVRSVGYVRDNQKDDRTNALNLRFPWRLLFQPKQPFVIAAFHRREAAEAPLALKTKGAGEPVINDRPITLRGVALGSPRLLSGLCQVIVDDVIIPTPRRHYYHRGSTFLTAWRRLQKGHEND